MRACALASLVILSCECVTLLRRTIEPLAAKFQVELPALYIPCKLNDIVTIAAPLRHKTNAEYYLYKPNGDVTQLDIKPPIPKHRETETVVKFEHNDDKYFMWPKDSYKTVNLNAGHRTDIKTVDVIGDENNDIVIGPLLEDDYGNWVLSLFANENGERVEWFQVITLDITEYVPLVEIRAQRSPGETFELGFAYPMKSLTSCQLTVPNSSYDRFYERSSTDSCKFIIRNITLDDDGFWAIFGVGRITYWGKLYLRVIY